MTINDQAEEFLHLGVRESATDLVEKKQARIRCHRPSEFQHLALR